jgi:hypothetical protein
MLIGFIGIPNLHIAHPLHAVHTMASVPAKTANKPLIRIRALMRVSY